MGNSNSIIKINFESVQKAIANKNSLGMRFTTVYGPGAREQMLIPRILKNNVPYINTNHSRDFIHVYDICSAIESLLRQKQITAFDEKPYLSASLFISFIFSNFRSIVTGKVWK